MAQRWDVNPHDMLSLAAAGTLLFYQVQVRPQQFCLQAQEDEIYRLTLALAALLQVYEVDCSGASCRPLTPGETEALLQGIEQYNRLNEPAAKTLELAVSSRDLKRIVDAMRKSRMGPKN